MLTREIKDDFCPVSAVQRGTNFFQASARSQGLHPNRSGGLEGFAPNKHQKVKLALNVCLFSSIRAMECLGLEDTFKGHPVQPP